jgi:AraC-like DNA-binding protein
MRYLPLVALIILLPLACAPEDPGEQAGDGPFQPMRVERLPDLHAPRGAHQTRMLDGELTVLGGHTDGFKPLETLEYFRDGAWHVVPMAHAHDGGFAVTLPDGTVMMGGGSAESFGIGQTWGADLYNPATHTVRTIGVMDRKRAYASALALPDGRVLIAGNWYAGDAVALYDPATGFSLLKELPEGWMQPWILPVSEEEFIFFGHDHNMGGPVDAQVERLRGEAFREPLLETWEIPMCCVSTSSGSCIGENMYLLPARGRADGRWGLLKVAGGVFSEVELDTPIPSEGVGGKPVVWLYPAQVDRPRRTAWMQGSDRDGHRYFARIDYDAILDGGKASVELFSATCPEGRFFHEMALLVPDGRLVLAGGTGQDERSEDFMYDSFSTTSAVWVFQPGPVAEAGRFPWGWLAGGGLLLGGVLALVFRRLRRRRALAAGDASLPEDAGTDVRTDLLAQMSVLIEEKELWKRKDLRIGDIAAELASNRTYVSALLNGISGTSFTALINGYRIRHAQRLMLEHPDMVLDQVAEESGFSSRTAFYSNFKALTGLSPKQWLRSQGS